MSDDNDTVLGIAIRDTRYNLDTENVLRNFNDLVQSLVSYSSNHWNPYNLSSSFFFSDFVLKHNNQNAKYANPTALHGTPSPILHT